MNSSSAINLPDGARLNYLSHGEGAPFIFVHGACGSMAHGHYLGSALSSRYRFISYSQRFHLPNDPMTPGRYGAALHSSDLLALLDALEISSCTALGHSYGALVLLAAALKAPHRFSRIVLAEPSLLFLLSGKEKYAHLSEQRDQAFGLIRNCFAAGRPADAVAALMSYANAQRGFKAFPEDIRLDMIANATSLWHLVYRQEISALTKEETANLKLPVTLFLGAECNPVYRAMAEELRLLLPQAEIIEVPGTAHDLVYTCAGAMADFI